MTRDEAQFLLAARRPNGADDADPQMAEALALAQRDPELARWLAHETASDGAVSRQLTDVRPPPHLRERILAGRPVAQMPMASRRRRTFWLAAAGLVLLLALGGWWRQHSRPATLAAVQRELMTFLDEDWNHSFDLSHPEFATIRDWLGAQPTPVRFEVSGQLAAGRTYGCKTFRCQGRPVTMICFSPRNEQTVVHVFSLPCPALPDAPGETPQLARVGGYSTASWRRDGQLYVAVSTEPAERLARWL